MNIKIMEKELEGIQARFNRTFGNQATCDINTRSLVIMSIANMGAIIKKIKKNGNHSETRSQVLLLNRMRDIINMTFDRAENPVSERRTHGTNG